MTRTEASSACLARKDLDQDRDWKPPWFVCLLRPWFSRLIGGFECELLHIKAKREERGERGKKRGERGERAAGDWRDSNIIKSKRRRGKEGKVRILALAG